MSALKIEHGIPLPPVRGGRRSRLPLPLAGMESGDSILIPVGPDLPFSAAYRLVIYHGGRFREKHPHVTFPTRKVAGGLRVWRVDGKPGRAAK